RRAPRSPLFPYTTRFRSAIEVPRRDGAVRIDYLPGGEVAVAWRPLTPRALPVVLTPYVLPGGLGEHKWRDRSLLDAIPDALLLEDRKSTRLNSSHVKISY